jgi:hypothetical protein
MRSAARETERKARSAERGRVKGPARVDLLRKSLFKHAGAPSGLLRQILSIVPTSPDSGGARFACAAHIPHSISSPANPGTTARKSRAKEILAFY